MRTQTYFGGSLSGAPVTVGLLAINVIVFLLLTLTGGSQDNINLYRWGAKFGPAIADGEWWRLFLPMFMHIGFFHLATNSFGLLIFGSMAERIFGSRTYLAIYLVSGVVGNVASFVMTPALGAGASGAVFGVVGAFGIFLLLNRRLTGQMGRQSLVSVAVIVALNLLIGFTVSGIDNAAHVGGLVTGGVMAFIAGPRQRLVLTTAWGALEPPRLAIQQHAPRAGRVALAVAVGVAVIALGTWMKSTDYPYVDSCKDQFGLKFMDFSSGNEVFGVRCTSVLVRVR